MHHYDARLTLLSSEAGGKQQPVRSGYPCLAQVAGLNFDGFLTFDAVECLPGGTLDVRLTFNRPELVCPLIREGADCPVLEGARTVGTLHIIADAWKNIDDVVQIGMVLSAKVQNTDWTRASLRLSSGATSSIRSAHIGLRPWADISDRLQIGDQLRVRVIDVDKVRREITVLPADEPFAAGA
jgi:predicted RNA-binding protein with RPS1 domain